MMPNSNKILLLGLLLVAGAVCANNIIPGAKQTHPILLKGGTLYTVSNEVMPNTDLLFDNGRITQIGQNITPPSGAEIVDAMGKFVYPGIIDAYSNIGLVEVGSIRATTDEGEVGKNNADVQSQIAYNPDSEIIPTIRTNGITTVLVVPGGSLVQGQSCLMNLDGWTREDAAEELRVGLHLNWPQAAIITAWWMERTPEEQKKEMEQNKAALGTLFDDARSYMIAKKADPSLPQDSRWEAMLPIFSGELPVYIYANDYRQIEDAVAFSKKYGFRMILTGGRESWKLISLLKENNIPAIYGNVDDMPLRPDDDYDQSFKIPKLLQDAGVKFCVATFDNWNARNLPFQAGYTVAFGLTKDQAIRSITLSAAEILGVAKDLGSLEVGKKATLFVSRGDILDPMSAGVTMEYIEGRKVDLDNKQLELYRKYLAKHWSPAAK